MTTSAYGNITITSGHVVLVEGADEVNLLSKMLEALDVHDLQVVNARGKNNFRAVLEAVLETAERVSIPLSSVAILRDADNYPDRTLQSVQDAVRTAGLVPPDSHGAFSQGPPAVGIFILPDGAKPGAIEDLCWQAVEATPAARCSAAYLECLQASNALASNNHSKTLVHTYLASRLDPSATVGVGALQGSWPLSHAAFDPLKAFLEELATI